MRKIGRRIAAWIAAIAILFAFEAHIPVYAEENGTRLNKWVECTYLAGSDANAELDGEWYAVDGEVTIDGNVTFTNSSVNLILCNKTVRWRG